MEGNKIRTQERKIDRKLNIRTIGIRKWKNNNIYNRCEPTPYRALESLFNIYQLNESDSFVDFGFGKGRVLFYVHYKFNVKVTGIEAEDLSFDEALANLQSYSVIKPNAYDDITLEYGLAEDYKIKKTDNVFYFFNPFDISIFKIIYKNIVKSIKKYPRDVDLIVYYSIPKYIKFLSKSKHFKLFNKFDIPDKRDIYQQVIIYRHQYKKKRDENLNEIKR